MAQWLERRSLTGKLSLIYAWSMVDMWPLRGLGVRCGSTNQANSAFHPFGVCKWVVIHVITWITEVETIKRQAGTVCSCLAVRLARVCGLSLQPIGCTVCPSLWCYISFMPLPFLPFTYGRACWVCTVAVESQYKLLGIEIATCP